MLADRGLRIKHCLNATPEALPWLALFTPRVHIIGLQMWLLLQLLHQVRVLLQNLSIGEA